MRAQDLIGQPGDDPMVAFFEKILSEVPRWSHFG